ncbi:MAG: Acetoin utilization protein AcuC [Pseudomonadota bacterium]|jgi:histone deacetylase 11
MKIFYNKNYNIDFGIVNRIHPFDGTKYAKVYAAIKDFPGIDMQDVPAPITLDEAKEFANDLLKLFYVNKRYILNALALPYIPLLPFSFIDRKILLPMRWAVAGTIAAAKYALQGNYAWNLGGGYHHATRAACEGFCIYNDIGIAVRQLRQQGLLAADAKILIIDVDAHHGNGNAYVFMDDANATLLDIYNKDIYPQGIEADFTKRRVNIALPIPTGTSDPHYLQRLAQGLALLQPGFALAFVVAGTDVLQGDPLGGLCVSVEGCVQRDSMILARLRELGVPAVFLGGGGYSPKSAIQIAASLRQNYLV